MVKLGRFKLWFYIANLMVFLYGGFVFTMYLKYVHTTTYLVPLSLQTSYVLAIFGAIASIIHRYTCQILYYASCFFLIIPFLVLSRLNLKTHLYESTTYMVVYYFVPALLIVFALITMYAMNRWIQSPNYLSHS